MAETFPKLVVLSGPEDGQTFALPPTGHILIGRSDDNQFQLQDSSVSRQHVLVIAREGKYFLRDENSRNGTILEGRKLAGGEEVSLSHLDEFKLGIYELRFVEKPFTESDVKLKKQQNLQTRREFEEKVPPTSFDKSVTKRDVEKIEKSSPKVELPPQEGEEFKAESLIDDILEEKEHVEEKLPAKKTRLTPILLFVLLLISVSFAAWVNRDKLSPWLAKIPGLNPIEKTSTDNDLAKTDATKTVLKNKTSETPVVPSVTSTEPASEPALPEADTNVTVVPVPTQMTAPATATFNVFLDVETKPFPAVIYFEDKRLGQAPLKANVEVEADKTYAVYADYELRDVGDIYRKKVLFKAKPNSDVIEINVDAEIGVLKIQKLPPRVEFYLEGYYDYDKDKANPVKLTKIVYGKPIYLPYGKYAVELKENVSVGGSSNLIKQTRFQREYTIDAETPALELSVLERDLKVFPAVIKSDPSNADVILDDEVIGTTPFRGNLPIGKNEVRIVKDGFFEKTLDIEMNMNSIYETSVTLETSKVGELLNAAKEHIRQNRLPEAMDTLVDALKYGGSTSEKAEVYFLLGEGYYKQKLLEQAAPYYEKARTHPDYALRATLGLARVSSDLKDDVLALQYVIEVLANLTSETPASLRGEANSVFKKISQFKPVIYIHTDPAGADVFVNSKKREIPTPIILSELTVRTYNIEIEKPGYQTHRTKVSPKMGEFVLIKVRLTKENL